MIARLFRWLLFRYFYEEFTQRASEFATYRGRLEARERLVAERESNLEQIVADRTKALEQAFNGARTACNQCQLRSGLSPQQGLTAIKNQEAAFQQQRALGTGGRQNTLAAQLLGATTG